MSRARKRADRIRETIPIQQVLSDYGYAIEAGYDGEQQFSCDLHGDGSDSKPSARVYPDSASWYCFACDQTRDAIETMREKEGLEFWQAIKRLEKQYHLPPLPWDDDDQEEYEARKKTDAVDIVNAALDPTKSFEDDKHKIYRLLDGVTTDKDLPVKTVVSLWEAFDKVCYLVEREQLTEQAGRTALDQILERTMDKIKGGT